MPRIGIYYGSTTGNTQEVAEDIAKKLNVDKADLHDVAKANADYTAYDVVLFGSPTLGFGDLQDDWEDYIGKVKGADLNGKTVALFGCGDSSSYSDTFGDAIGKIYQTIKDKGCKLIGQVSTDGYTYDDSEAIVDGKFVGLLIDNDNESDLTDERIENWIEELKKFI
ncbi:flavodoxin I [Dysgonomonas sp. PFB1-18]|uniref:flavodoxin n=1 Tax=unclassified Dysgonomonas TaxID=2630389 RepID=UPI002476E0AF|nr:MULTISPECIES: flavodoxin [unclassified Dysgonomonas]MDH6307843.1 flavodoxin I [Dysgonomonas sp. PF1-14]MDH6337761.1 flavodoxin I [Dysgonomonas sp. PF1-16]MDH6378985.1 flavodoxin I [Dysgonomonas sp. PFB1-18]MDH6396620.1 flavodoxin I [Dysgonomonas sp. PF1-23]